MIDFERMHRAVAELNQESDTLNEAIRDFEERLEEVGAGCEAWLARAFMGYSLGYAKIGGKWCLAVLREDEPASPLLSAPRVVRIAACEHFAELAEQILIVVESRLHDIRRARKIVKEIGK